jgi:hypothetical protein
MAGHVFWAKVMPGDRLLPHSQRDAALVSLTRARLALLPRWHGSHYLFEKR